MTEKFKDYLNNGNLKVYLAGPFFSEEQIDRISFMEKALDEFGFDVFSPRQASLISKESTKQDMITTFEGNISHIDDCDLVVCVLDLDKDIKYSDTGTVFEFGYAYSKNKPVLCFNENRDKGANLMLAMSGKLPYITKTTSLKDLFNEDIKDISIKYGFDIEKKNPRVVLRNVLSLLSKTSLNEVVKITKTYIKDIQ